MTELEQLIREHERGHALVAFELPAVAALVREVSRRIHDASDEDIAAIASLKHIEEG